MYLLLVFIVFILFSVPIGIAFLTAALIPGLIDSGFPFSVELAVKGVMSGVDSGILLAIPLFILSGDIMARGGISAAIYNFFAYFTGKMTAGYPNAVIVTCLFYGAISGSAAATVAAVGAMCIPLLVNLGYDKKFSTSLVAISGGLGVIIPPSIPFIVYSTSARVSTGDMFIAGILPGILIAFLLILYTTYYCKNHGEDREKLLENYKKIKSVGFLNLFKKSIWALFTPVIILGCIYGGIATPTEAAAISVYYALFVSVVVYRSIKPREIYSIIVQSVKTNASIFFVIGTAVAFARVLSLLQVPQNLGSLLAATASSRIGLLLLCTAILLFIGMFIDVIPSILIFTPIFLPALRAVGVNPIHYGILMIVTLAIGLVTPPMGINLFVASSITRIDALTIAKGAVPMIIMFLIALIILILVPQISLLLI